MAFFEKIYLAIYSKLQSKSSYNLYLSYFFLTSAIQNKHAFERFEQDAKWAFIHLFGWNRWYTDVSFNGETKLCAKMKFCQISWYPHNIGLSIFPAERLHSCLALQRLYRKIPSSLFSICKSMEYTDCLIPTLLFLLLAWFSIIWLLISSCLSGLSSINLLNFNKLKSKWKT